MSKRKSIISHPEQYTLYGVSNSDFSISIVSDRLAIIGDEIPFKKEPLFGLLPGTLINQIGNGKDNGCIRTDEFAYPVKYVGSIICDFQEKEKMYAFELPVKHDNKNIYLIYGSTGKEIFTEDTYSKKEKTAYVRFYKPNFVLSDC